MLYSLDHHHGSEENQEGWEHFDPSLVDPLDGRLNTLPSWQRTIAIARLESTVLGLVGPSLVVAAHFDQALDLLFIDGGHGARGGLGRLRGLDAQGRGGRTAHDPRRLRRPRATEDARPTRSTVAALESGRFVDLAREGSLRALTRAA